MVMIDPRTTTVVVPDPEVAAQRQAVLLAAARWWRLEARLASALAADTAEPPSAADPPDAG